MAKCVRLYNDSIAEFAQSQSGVWFRRVYEKTLYGYSWSKWICVGHLTYVNRMKRTYENLNGNIITERLIFMKFENNNGSTHYYFKRKHKLNVTHCNYRLPY